MSSAFDDLARTLAAPMPRGRAMRAIGAAFAVAAFPALRPERALAGAARQHGAAGKAVRCFVAIPMGTHEGGSYYPEYQKCCKGPNNDEQHPNQMSWVCPNDHSCGSAASGFCPGPKKCADGVCCPSTKGRCVDGTAARRFGRRSGPDRRARPLRVVRPARSPYPAAPASAARRGSPTAARSSMCARETRSPRRTAEGRLCVNGTLRKG